MTALLPLALMAAGYGLTPASLPGREAAETAERTLAAYINAERAAHGLPPVAFSPNLARVAQAHVRDLVENRPDTARDRAGRRCSMHSWSAGGAWTPICFNGDAASAMGMWNKPHEITRGAYSGYGFEVAYRMPGGANPEIAMDGWMASGAHRAVILETGVWSDTGWQAMGVAIQGDYAVAWFGKEADPGLRAAEKRGGAPVKAARR